MDTTTTLIICAVIGYFLGSIPFGLVITWLSGNGDVRKVGSKSIGATNVLRATGSKTLTLLTILLDAFKAGGAAVIAKSCLPNSHIETSFIISGNEYLIPLGTIYALTAGLFAIIGHSFPIWLKFKGGKGVASAFGLILVLSPAVALLALSTWIFIALTTRYSSLSAITAATLSPIYAWFFAGPVYVVFYIPMVILVLARHHSNIRRLLKGEESKIIFKKKQS